MKHALTEFFDNCLDDFYSYIQVEKGLSLNTVAAYLSDLRLFYNHLRLALSQKSDASFSLNWSKQNLANECYLFMKEELPLFIEQRKTLDIKENSIRRELASLRSFFTFLEKRSYIKQSLSTAIADYRTAELPREILSESEVHSLLSTCDKSDKTSKRNYLLLKMLYALGLRVSEVGGLQLSDFDLSDGFLLVKGKGNKKRILPLYDGLVCNIKHYVNEVRPLYCNLKRRTKQVNKNTIGNFFLNKNGGAISRVSIWKIVWKACKQAGLVHIKKISPHTLRHTFATHLVQNGADIRVVQELLGHASLTTTEVYTHLHGCSLRESFKKYHPMYYGVD